MQKASKNLSVVDLEKLLLTRKSQVDGLNKRREKLKKDLDSVEQRISAIQGHASASPTRKTRHKTVKRPMNPKSLRTYATEALSKNKSGFPLAKLAEKVIAAGYKTNSANFRNVLYQCLYNAKTIVHDEKTGHWRSK
jgi:phage shock protein A